MTPVTPGGSPRGPRCFYREVFLGIAIDYAWPSRYSFYSFDGAFCFDVQERENVFGEEAECDFNRLHEVIYDDVVLFMETHQFKVIMAGLSLNGDSSSIKKLGHLLWERADILPCLISAQGESLEEIACSAARKTAHYLSASQLPGLPRVLVGYRHEVEVDANGAVEFAGLDSYRSHCEPTTWKFVLNLASRVRQKDLSIVFINSTPQGGGVAILRHSMVRFLRLLGIRVHWFVMRPHPEVFEITKKKFHNVLQGVAPENTSLTENDKDVWIRWCESNAKTYWKDGPVVMADVIVIDDPQPCGIIPFLKQRNPKARIVYRSHIELRSDLTEKEGTEQYRVWQFLWQFIKQADVFVSHPVEAFVPACIRARPDMRHFQMPASTDPVDGLNKPLDKFAMKYYQTLFNRMARDQIGYELNFSRPYFIQISRFDPSKGIPDLIEAYISFREAIIETDVLAEDVPQLVITGHGSIDDPEGEIIYKQVIACTEADRALPYQDDIIIVRLGPSDQILNALLRGALAAFQLSIREGFEIKVTEALIKGVPVVAYASGGIPLQIINDHDGFLFPVGSVDLVAEKMQQFVENPQILRNLSKPAHSRDWLLTPSNACRWLCIMLGQDPPLLAFSQ